MNKSLAVPSLVKSAAIPFFVLMADHLQGGFDQSPKINHSQNIIPFQSASLSCPAHLKIRKTPDGVLPLLPFVTNDSIGSTSITPLGDMGPRNSQSPKDMAKAESARGSTSPSGRRHTALNRKTAEIPIGFPQTWRGSDFIPYPKPSPWSR